jgi:transcriptional regulator with XRE-family HTH domain
MATLEDVPAPKSHALGSRIRQHREAAKLTLKELGSKLESAGLDTGTSAQHLSSVERGNTWPSNELVAALDSVLETHSELMHLLRDARVRMSPRPSQPGEGVAVTAHLFFPLLVSTLPSEIKRHVRSSHDFVPRLGALSSTVDQTVLHCFPFNVVVVHEQHTLLSGSLPTIATWRRTQIERCATAAADHLGSLGLDLSPLDHEPYCLSAFVIDELPWEAVQMRSRANQILAMPSVLVSDHDSPASAEDRATILLNSPEPLCDVCDFSLTNSHFGAASWAGVSSLPITNAGLDTAIALVEFELQLQAFWCYVSNTEARGAFVSETYGARFMRQVLGKLQRPWPREHTAVRLLREALVSTSRIVKLVDSAIEATGTYATD